MGKNKLLVAVIAFGIISVCFTTFGEERVKDGESSVEEESVEDNEGDSVGEEMLYRDPFSLPEGVRFREKVKKRQTVALPGQTEFPEGMVASNLNGVYQSGKNITANINGIWVKEGDWVGEERVIDIREDNVLLGKEDGEERTLSLQEAESVLKVIEKVKPVSKEEK